jgi:hypothetical protein
MNSSNERSSLAVSSPTSSNSSSNNKYNDKEIPFGIVHDNEAVEENHPLSK